MRQDSSFVKCLRCLGASGYFTASANESFAALSRTSPAVVGSGLMEEPSLASVSRTMATTAHTLPITAVAISSPNGDFVRFH